MIHGVTVTEWIYPSSLGNTQTAEVGELVNASSFQQPTKYTAYTVILSGRKTSTDFRQNTPGQGLELQVRDSKSGPNMVQSLPPKFGAGFVQDRVLCCIPPPQVEVHSVHSLHEVKFPFTREKKHVCLLCILWVFNKIWTAYSGRRVRKTSIVL